MYGYDRLIAIKDHETVITQGFGPLGNFAAAVAKDHGAKKVLVIGTPAHRLEVSKKMGANDLLNLETTPVPVDRGEWALSHTKGRGADIVMQIANNAAVPEGLTMLRDGGQFLDIGAARKGQIPVERMPQQMTYLTARSGEPGHWLQAVDFLASRVERYPFDGMISRAYNLEQVNEAMNAMANFEVVKPVINL